MSQSSIHLRRLIEVARLDIDYIEMNLSTALTRLAEAQPGFPSGGDGGGGGGDSIVERLALTPDQARIAAPLLQRLTTLRDSMAASRRGGASAGTKD